MDVDSVIRIKAALVTKDMAEKEDFNVELGWSGVLFKVEAYYWRFLMVFSVYL